MATHHPQHPAIIMRTSISGVALSLCAFGAGVLTSSAQIVTQWNFNSVTPDANSSTGSVLASFGSGTATAIGGVTTAFAAGSPRDIAASDNTAWSLSGWPVQGTASGTAGAVFMASTAGFSLPIQVSFDLRQTATASERFQLQATADGTTFTNVNGGMASFGTVGNNTATSFDSSGLFVNTAASSSQAFVQSVTYTFVAGSAYENNANFGFRVVSVFEGLQYDAAGANSNYGTSGNLRIDMVTVSTGGVPVPEPATSAAMLGLVAMAAVLVRRRPWRQTGKTGQA